MVYGDAWVSGKDHIFGNEKVVKDDLFKVLEITPTEVPFLIEALKAGKVDGSVYGGDCACLVGTLAKAKNCKYDQIPGLKPDSNRPAEQWFMGISPGDTAENSPTVVKTLEWIDEFQNMYKAKEKVK